MSRAAAATFLLIAVMLIAGCDKRVALKPRTGIFDGELKLPGSPAGAASNGREILIANRKEPWGFIRVRPSGEKFTVEGFPVIGTEYKQKLAFDAVTWNGTKWVVAMLGSWFQSPHEHVFATLTPETFAVESVHEAPPFTGCIAWDGEHYWAATRKNTQDAPEEAFLYRLDRELNVLDKFTPPGVGCQGLAWDGHLLWFSDVFSGSLYAINPAEMEKRIEHSLPTSYPSGVAWDGEHVWVAEYGSDLLLRLSKETRLADLPATLKPTAEAPFKTVMEAKNENPFPEPHGPETADLIDWSVKARDGAILGSWRIFFGDALFEPTKSDMFPCFVQYRVTVSGGTLKAPVERSFEGTIGEHIKTDVPLVSDVGPGEYDVELFIHVQYVSGDGTNKIINKSEAPLHLAWR